MRRMRVIVAVGWVLGVLSCAGGGTEAPDAAVDAGAADVQALTEPPPPCVAADESTFPQPCTAHLDEAPCTGPFWPIDTYIGTSADGRFAFYHALGTGNFFCDPLGATADGNHAWRSVRGPDFGTIDDEGLMSMVVSTDNYTSDGGVYLAHDGVETFRSFRREDGLPCQNADVSFTQNVLTFGEPSMTGQDFFAVINYRCDETGHPGCAQLGTQGAYFYDRDRRAMYAIADNRSGLRAPDPATYEAAGVSYPCRQRYDVPVAACEGRQADCHWVLFEGLPGSNDRDQLVLRGSYVTGDAETHTGIFVVEKSENTAGELAFEMWPVVATDEGVPVPGQPAGTTFDAVNKPWINDKGVVVFAATFAHDDTDATQGLFAALPRAAGGYDLVPIAHNGGARAGFDDFHLPREGEDLSRFADRATETGALSTSASIDLVSNNAGPDGLGHVFFAAGFWDDDTRRKGVFRAEPTVDPTTGAVSFLCDGAPCTGATPLVRSGEDALPGNDRGWVFGTFHSLSVNDNDQIVLKAMSEDRTLGIVLFYDGTQVHEVPFEDHLFPPGFSEDFWYILGNYALNNHGTFLFRISTLWSNPDPDVRETTTAWAVWRAEFLGP